MIICTPSNVISYMDEGLEFYMITNIHGHSLCWLHVHRMYMINTRVRVRSVTVYYNTIF